MFQNVPTMLYSISPIYIYIYIDTVLCLLIYAPKICTVLKFFANNLFHLKTDQNKPLLEITKCHEIDLYFIDIVVLLILKIFMHFY